MSLKYLNGETNQRTEITFGSEFMRPVRNATALKQYPTRKPDKLESPVAVDIGEVCRLLSIGRTSVFSLLKAGQLRSFKIGRRRLVVRESVIDFVEKRIAD